MTNAHIVRRLINNSWDQPALTLEQARDQAEQIQLLSNEPRNRRGETRAEETARIDTFISTYGANGRNV